MTDAKEMLLETPPQDGISSVKFSPTNPDHLLVASWDCDLRLYDVGANSERSRFSHKAAVLTCCFSDDTHAFSGGLDTWIRSFDLPTERPTIIGTHHNAVSSTVWSTSTNSLVSGSWDQTVRVWDPRSTTQTASSTHPHPERIYCMDITGNNLVVGMAGRLVNIWDLRNMGEPLQRRESSLRFMTRTIACMADGAGYAMTSVEGRVAVEYFDPSSAAQAKKYAFKCHRQTIDGEDVVWPVNALAFHPTHNTFASGGSDGTVSLWDHSAKKRLRQYPKYSSAVNALSFSNDGRKLAIGISYAWDQGAEGARKDDGKREVRIREVGDDVKPRPKA